MTETITLEQVKDKYTKFKLLDDNNTIAFGHRKTTNKPQYISYNKSQNKYYNYNYQKLYNPNSNNNCKSNGNNYRVEKNYNKVNDNKSNNTKEYNSNNSTQSKMSYMTIDPTEQMENQNIDDQSRHDETNETINFHE